MSAIWVKSAMEPKLGSLPAWVVLPWPYMFINAGVISISLTVGTLAFAAYLTSKGRTLLWTIKRIKTKLRANKMEARPLGYRRAMNVDVTTKDFDFNKWREE